MLKSAQKQKGYIEIIILIMIALVALVIWPVKFPTSQNSPSPSSANIGGSCAELPPPDKAALSVDLPPILSFGEGGIDLNSGTLRTYKIFRSGLKVNKIIGSQEEDDKGRPYFGDTKHTIQYQKLSLGDKNYMVYYPGRWPEIDVPIDLVLNGTKRPRGNYKTYEWDTDGMLFLVHLDDFGQPLEGSGTNFLGRQVAYYTVDVYRDTTFTDPLPEFLFCSNYQAQNNSSTSNAEVYFPNQEVSPDKKELQLEYFLFSGPTRGDIFNGHCKPAIYLYPNKETRVNVKVNTKGFLTYTDPKYPEGGWDVLAYPDGKLEFSTNNREPRTLNYLYYESKVPDELIDKPRDGYVVAYEKLSSLYDLILPQLGLDQTQIKDFKDYWSKALPYSPYYFVGIMDQKNIDSFEPLEVTPKPDLSIRVRLYFQAMEKKDAPDLTSILQLPSSQSSFHPPTSNFQLTEWGGMVKTNPLDKFTCSQ